MSQSIVTDVARIRSMTSAEALTALRSSTEGLGCQEALERQRSFGKNLVEERRGTSPLLKFLSNFVHLMAILLWAAGTIAFLAGMPELGVAVWLVNVINGLFSFWQEFRAGKATEALKRMLPSQANVVREGQIREILAEDLVVGDVMSLAEGDRISADARLISCSDFRVDQSTLTGESNPVRKSADASLEEGLSTAETPNLIFAGTSVAGGNARAVVMSIGMATEFGKIASLTQDVGDEQSPLQRQLDKLTKQVTVFALLMGVLFLLLDIFCVRSRPAEAFIFALGMVVAFIPEGLLPTVTLSLAMAVQRMSRRNALVKKLSSVEALGSTSVICTDKTGTLTQNEMTVRQLWTAASSYRVSGVGYSSQGDLTREDCSSTDLAGGSAPDEGLRLLLAGGSLCSNARLISSKENDGRLRVLGDPTEACLIVCAQKAGMDRQDLERRMPRVRELPFDSTRKRMTTVHELDEPIDGASRVAFVKGAPNEVLRLSTRLRVADKVIDLDDDLRRRITAAYDDYSARGLRVLAVAYRPLSSDDDGVPDALSAYTPQLIERDLTFVGLEAMQDPPRPEVERAVAECRRAGIRVIMITGDYGLTAVSIARKIGIVRGGRPQVISGAQLASMSDDELRRALGGEVVFARMAPEQKLRVVESLQAMGEIVAVTGDGVNDAPALKKADIGVAMGVSGTDVAKEAADMILTDDNFASIVHAIEEGRAVYANIRKFLLYILNSNVPEAVPSAVHLLSGGAVPLPLTTMQILTIDLGTDMLPALGLGTEPPQDDVMSQPPRDPHGSLLTRGLLVRAFLWYGLIAAGMSLIAFFRAQVLAGWDGNLPMIGVVNPFDPAYAQATTMALAAIVFAQVGQVYNCRTNKVSLLSVGIFSNRQINVGVMVELLIIAAIITLPPLQAVFGTTYVSVQDLWTLLPIPLAVIIIEEARKGLFRMLPAPSQTAQAPCVSPVKEGR
ncbi:cation-transporting P-type ATPase [Olsenella sp. HMSC062G07]|uniref:cation-translocating P-type ATPase n=1 Tax=Olsenella sp. HMSC062G07 TaxID=1739330 RepID=UPI000A7CD14F|nr:cation-transporting P-type ATPase [Olsenella sp. HMSC062G07]